jgi:tetratricopeptide (TPR) repeat protein
MRARTTKLESPPASAAGVRRAPSSFPIWALSAALAMLAYATFRPALECAFTNYDDPEYVTANIRIQQGLSWENLKWAAVTPVVSTWHPVTVLSHMADCHFFGLASADHHRVNVVLHVLNTVLVFLLFVQATGAPWRSALVAALFACHPLHVESVAWVAERKDVLCTFFGLLSLTFYVRYVEKCSTAAGRRPGALRIPGFNSPSAAASYSFAWALLAFGLMSKPMLVTWPFVMLLLDFWPLKRFDRAQAARLVLEKIPFLVLAAAMCVITFAVQKQAGALNSGQRFSLGVRAGNALISYCRYLGKLIWPADLAVFYPHPGVWPAGWVIAAGVSLLAISAVLFAARQRFPFPLMGWLWFLGTLVPVIQLVQTGAHAMADRYTYIPSIGIFVAAVWGAWEMARRWRHHATISCAAAAAVLILCVGTTRRQLGYWEDSETLFRHGLAVVGNNYVCQENLGAALDQKGLTSDAIPHFREAILVQPSNPLAHGNLGAALSRSGRLDEAVPEFHEALRLDPGYAEARNNLASALARQGRLDEAVAQYQKAIELRPGYAEALNDLGNIYGRRGQSDAAIAQFQAALRSRPDIAEIHNNLGIAFAMKGQTADAVAQFTEALRLKPGYADARNNLARQLAIQNAPAPP